MLVGDAAQGVAVHWDIRPARGDDRDGGVFVQVLVLVAVEQLDAPAG
jgi:hypothetical protein